METMHNEWHNVEATTPEAPSQDFIRAVAELLETDADDLLTEMGYSRTEERELTASER
jgi:hypothetical protein